MHGTNKKALKHLVEKTKGRQNLRERIHEKTNIIKMNGRISGFCGLGFELIAGFRKHNY
jgi:hypothetical protein